MKFDETIFHLFPICSDPFELPEKFTFPFCYTPAAITKHAAEILMHTIKSDNRLHKIFSEGKMLGVLVVKNSEGKTGFLAGFSGIAGGMSSIKGFVPPIIDLTDPDGYFKQEESLISDINTEIANITQSDEWKEATNNLEYATARKEKETAAWKKKMAESKTQRNELRKHCTDTDILSKLIKESQFEKAELKRISSRCDKEIELAKQRFSTLSNKVSMLRSERSSKSEALQKWIFDNGIVENAYGEHMSIWDIFAKNGLVPPGGTGECAAPKMLHYAFLHKMKPISMGEFWYGDPKGKSGETRLHGRFYPSCTGKCGPLLRYMLQGMNVEDNPLNQHHTDTFTPEILYEDDVIIAINKPSGVLSVPGKTGGKSIQEILGSCGHKVFSVHRLDMDTSGVLVFAKNEDTAKILQEQFAERSVEKRYVAILDISEIDKDTKQTESSLHDIYAGKRGVISLPLIADFNDRPRQKVDFENGKEAVTEYYITAIHDSLAFISFTPITGRTHQLRVHSAHKLGLGCPILGDRLYGSGFSTNIQRLMLHAESVSFRHPKSGQIIKITTPPEF